MLNDDEVDTYIRNEGMETIQKFLENSLSVDQSLYNLANIIELLCVLVKKKSLDYQSLIDIS